MKTSINHVGIDFDSLQNSVCIKFDKAGQDLNFAHSFISDSFQQRLLQPNQALYKACRNRQRNIHSVLDLTAGWGIDGFLLASHGYQVTMLEHNELVFKLLSNSLEIAKLNTRTLRAAERIQAIRTNALAFLHGLEAGPEFDCIYLDPMFPNHRSSAKPGKDMQVLQALTENLDIVECASIALLKARNRVVIKRPAKAPALIHDVPVDLVYREKTIRFDVYLTR